MLESSGVAAHAPRNASREPAKMKPAGATAVSAQRVRNYMSDIITRMPCMRAPSVTDAVPEDEVSETRNRPDAATLIRMEGKHSAPIASPFPVVFERGEGAYLYDTNGEKYLDLVTGYSVVNQGHANPRIIKAMTDQANKLALTSRVVYNDKLPLFLEAVSRFTGYEQVIPMNSGAEAVETAIKLARRHGYAKKGIPENKAEIIVFDGNFHGRTMSAVSMSSDAGYQHGFGPFLPNMIRVPYGDAEALKNAITPNTAAVIIEPIQGEAGIKVPPNGYLRQVQDITREHQVLFIADEIQTGLGRTGKRFAYQHTPGVEPDVLILGKALSGGMYPISAVVSSKEIMSVFEPGSHGSTFGGNPIASAVGIAALKELEDGRLISNAQLRGTQIRSALKQIKSPLIAEVRGKGLFIGVELTRNARPIAEALLENEHMFTKDTHGTTLRIAPILGISQLQAHGIAPAIQRVLDIFEHKVASEVR